MIVWGGANSSGSFNTGGRYNRQHRQLDSHQHLRRARCPIQSHCSLDWQPNDRLGRNNSVPQLQLHPHTLAPAQPQARPQPPTLPGTGGRYDPMTHGWIATSTTNAPDARNDHTAVWTGSEMIVWWELVPVISTPAADTIPASTVGQPPARPTPPLRGTITPQSGLAAK